MSSEIKAINQNLNKHLDFLRALESGEIRAAVKVANRNTKTKEQSENHQQTEEQKEVQEKHQEKEKTDWVINVEVKQQILQMFKESQIADMGSEDQPQYYGYIDKELLKARIFSVHDKVRMIPGGSSVRVGAHIGLNVIIMPPAYINIGAYVDDDTMIDSHVLVGSCAQIGKRVHLSAAVQVGGVLEPVGNRPVIIEDDCFIGAGAILTEGILVREGAVIAPGVVLSAAVPIYDVVNQKIYKNEIPCGAVVVPGSRPLKLSSNRTDAGAGTSGVSVNASAWAKEQGLSLNCAIIIKYRNQKTDSAVTLESLLR